MKAQYNAISNKAYEGQNQQELLAEKLNKGYQSDAWVTFLQAKDLGRYIKRGSHGIHVFRGYGEFTEKREDGKTVTEKRPLGWANVFNLDQTEVI